jgi:F0F1-type ATP synthase delta subunit
MKKGILIYFDIITSLKTTLEVDDFVLEIDALISAYFKSENVSMEKALELISTNSAKKIMQTFSKNNLDINSRDIVTNFLNTLRDLVKKLKVVKLVLAFNPTYKIIEDVHSLIERTLGIGYVLDIEISEDILGGAIIVFNGKYFDFSLKKNIENIFETKKEEILTLIR